jgi:hypothetical protein
MTEPGEQRPSNSTGETGGRGWSAQQVAGGRGARGGHSARSRSLPGALLVAGGVMLLAAAAWALLRGVFELGPTSLAIAALGGWGIGAVLRQARAPVLLAVFLGLTAWLLGLVLSWLLAMALLPSSARTFAERLEGTPFLDWLTPQLGLLEMVGLLVYGAAAAYAARPSARPTS